MKTNIAVLFCLFICLFASSSFSEEPKPTSMTDVAMQAEKDLAASITTLSQKLEQVVENTAPVVWKSFCKQQVILGISELATCFVVFCVAVVLLLWWRSMIKSIHKVGYNEDVFAAQAIVNGILSFIVCISILIIFGNNIIGNSMAKIVNPEYYAIQNFIELVKK
jgi:predicted membrane protein